MRTNKSFNYYKDKGVNRELGDSLKSEKLNKTS